MSIRTVIEINHDYAHRIDADRFEFCNLLKMATNSASAENWAKLERFGVRRVFSAHHSDERLDAVFKAANPQFFEAQKAELNANNETE